MTEAGAHTRRVMELYRGQLIAVNRQKKRVNELRNHVFRSQGLTVGTYQPEAVVMRLDGEVKKLHHMETILLTRRAMADSYLNKIKDPVTRFIMYLRYIDGLSWKAIAVRHGCGASESTVRMTVTRYMDKHPL